MTALALDTPRPRAAWLAEAKATASLAWPIAATNLATMAITTTDVILLGWLSPQALAAGALAVNLYYALTIWLIGMAMAATPLMAQALGRKHGAVREMRRSLRMGAWVVIAATLITWPLLWHTEAILGAIGQDPDLARLAGIYIRALMWGLPFFMGFMLLKGFFAAVERPTPPLVVTLLAIGVNAILGYALIFGHFGLPRLELVGAGIAATFSSMILCLGLLGVCLTDRRLRRYSILGRWWRADWPRLKELLRIGGPIALSMTFEVSVFNVSVFIIGWISVAAIAAHAIAIQLASITFMVPFGIAQAATVRVGLAAGAGEREAAGRAGWVAIILGAGFMLLMAGLFLTAARPIVGLFLDRGDPATAAVSELAVSLLAVAGLFQVADGVQSIGAGALRGLSDTRVPMIFAGIGYWVLGLPVGALFAFTFGFGAVGIWIGLATGLAIVAVLLVRRWSRRTALGLDTLRASGTAHAG